MKFLPVFFLLLLSCGVSAPSVYTVLVLDPGPDHAGYTYWDVDGPWGLIVVEPGFSEEDTSRILMHELMHTTVAGHPFGQIFWHSGYIEALRNDPRIIVLYPEAAVLRPTQLAADWWNSTLRRVHFIVESP